MSLFGELVPKVLPAEVQQAVDDFRAKLDRIIELLEQLVGESENARQEDAVDQTKRRVSRSSP